MVEKQTDTEASVTTSGCQTKLVQTSRTIGTLTEPDRKDVGEQTMLPTLFYEDVMDNPERLRFYTGIPDKEMFDELKKSTEYASRTKSKWRTTQCPTRY